MPPSAPRRHGLFGYHLLHPFPALTVATLDKGRSESGPCVGPRSNSVSFRRTARNCSVTALPSDAVASLFPVVLCRPNGSFPSEAYLPGSVFRTSSCQLVSQVWALHRLVPMALCVRQPVRSPSRSLRHAWWVWVRRAFPSRSPCSEDLSPSSSPGLAGVSLRLLRSASGLCRVHGSCVQPAVWFRLGTLVPWGLFGWFVSSASLVSPHYA